MARYLRLMAVALILLGSTTKLQAAEVAFDRVLASKTIRCGYFSWPPYLAVDPNTKKLSGINYDIMEAIAKNIGLKLDWVAEVGVGDIATALNTNKVDMMCGSVWPSPARTQSMTLSLPTFYSPALAFVRVDDKRFDGDINKANQKNIKVSGIDGDYSDDLSKEKLPLATQALLPQTASGSEILMQIVSKKADIVFTDAGIVNDFQKTNKNTLREVAGIGPVRYYGEVLAVKRGEYQLKNMLDTSIMQLTNDGVIDKIVTKYRKEYNATFYSPTKTFVNQ